MFYAIWYHLYNLKKREIHPRSCVDFSKVSGVSLQVSLLHGCFSRFLSCTNGTKLRKASHTDRVIRITNLDERIKSKTIPLV